MSIMKIIKFHFSKDCLKKVLRTFLQTAIGYIIANVTLYLGGIDFADGDVLRNALIGLAIAAFSAGSAAVMNLEKADSQNKAVNADDENEVNKQENNVNEIDKGEEKLNG